MNDFRALKRKAIQHRISVLNMLYLAKEGYLGDVFSCMEILVLLYFGTIFGDDILRVSGPNRDYLITSNYKITPAIYSLLADKKIIPMSMLKTYGQEGSELTEYLNPKISNIDISLSRPGMSLSVANGIALSLLNAKKDNRVFVLMSEAELQIGSVYEAMMASSHLSLENLTVFIDANKHQANGHTRRIMNIEPIADKFEAMGWNVIRVVDGNDVEELFNAAKKAFRTVRKPSVIVANTVKGKGVPFIENNKIYHNLTLSKEEMREAIPFLKSQLTY